jgi:putative radical SAM enzyme (TIGR03279 family)
LGHKIEDVLDWQFRTCGRRFLLKVACEGKKRFLTVKNPEYLPLGVEFEQPLLCRENACKNHCVFCFIDQLPRGMRRTLYFKDDDFRLSFLKGNYITLTNLSKRELDRVCKMRISPINISVHATDPEVRSHMLGNRDAGNILSLISKLARARITMNCQVVVCPGLNDGEVLEKTLDDLAEFYPQVSSVSIVPVGLTAHRERLCRLNPVGKKRGSRYYLRC